MKAIFDIPEETQVQAVKVFTVEADPNDPDPLLEDFPGPYELDMNVTLTLEPGKEYEVLAVKPDVNGICIWLNETLCIPDYPEEKVKLI